MNSDNIWYLEKPCDVSDLTLYVAHLVDTDANVIPSFIYGDVCLLFESYLYDIFKFKFPTFAKHLGYKILTNPTKRRFVFAGINYPNIFMLELI